MYILNIITFQHILFLKISDQNTNPSPRTGPQDLLNTHYDCEENEQKTLQKYAINQLTQCKTEPQAIKNYKYNSNIVFKSPSNDNHRIYIYSNILRKQSTLFTSFQRK